MSAFLCSARHISQIVHAADRQAPLGRCASHRLMRTTDNRLWTDHEFTFYTLLNTNVMSLRARYPGHPHDEEAIDHIFQSQPERDLSLVALLKLIQCYRYQSCEHQGWDGSPAEEWTRHLSAHLIRIMPCYEEAEWSLEGRVPAYSVGGSSASEML